MQAKGRHQTEEWIEIPKIKRDKNIDLDELRILIEQEFNRRKEKNAKYSLRAYARDLSIDQSHLGKFMCRKKSLSRLKAALVLDALSQLADLGPKTNETDNVHSKNV